MNQGAENGVIDRFQDPPRGIRVKSRWLRNLLTFFMVLGPWAV
jgi:hypothetical protein